MKKIVVILCLSLCLSLLGCGGKFANGFAFLMNGMKAVETYFCSFSVQQIADAIAAQKFVKDHPAVANLMVKAVQTFNNIQNRVCVTLPQLQGALAAFDQAVRVVQGQAALQKADVPAVPPLSALRTLAEKK